ncbi:hypothetical protein J4558_19800 [Leptolyngbya sp. 15MV]|nr:hypothetical protein J4558_19800 [Leptolyngbya sp. 15MV]
MNRKRIVPVLLLVVGLIAVVIATGLAADDRVFYGIIALIVLSQLAWLAYVAKRHRQEDIARRIGRLFPDE